MRARTLCAMILLSGLMAPAVASASSGGAVAVEHGGAPGAGDLTISIDAPRSDGKGQVYVRFMTRCDHGKMEDEATLPVRLRGGAVARTTFTARGGKRVVFSGTDLVNGGSGTFRAMRRGRGKLGRCDTGVVHWAARAAPTGQPPVGVDAIGAGPWFGAIPNRLADANGAAPGFVLFRTPGSALRVQAVWHAGTRCRGTLGHRHHQTIASEFLNLSPPMDVAPDGTFASTDRWSDGSNEGRWTWRVAVSGRFTATGAEGTVALTISVDPRRGRTLTCQAVTSAWSVSA